MRLADYLFDGIESIGVKNVYGVTGRGSLYLSDAVARNKNLTWIPMHHEQAAGFAALAESQLNRAPSVVVVSSGCASTNLMTPLLLAWQDFLPVIFISGQHFMRETQYFTNQKVRTFGQQETNVISLVRELTKWSTMITDSKQIDSFFSEGFNFMLNGRRGPIWIDIPLDLQSSTILSKGNARYAVQENVNSAISPASSDVIYLKDSLEKAKRPLLLVGSGVENSRAKEEVQRLSEAFDIPIIYSHTAVDSFSTLSENIIGSVGSMGCSQAAAIVLNQCDFLVVLGHRLGSYTTGPHPELFAQNSEVCVVDIDFTEIEAFQPHVDRRIYSDIKNLINALLQITEGRDNSDWFKKSCKIKKSLEIRLDKFSPKEPVDLYYLTATLSKVLPNDAVLITDSGYPEVIIPTNYTIRGNQRLIHPASQGSMGYALPAAVGASLNTSEIVCAVIGDGSIMMNLQELQTISDMKLQILILLINNDAYGIIRNRQDELFRGRTIGTDSSNGLSCPKFDQVAKAFGIKYKSVMEASQLGPMLKDIVEKNEFPLICEIKGLWDQKYPRVKSARRISESLSILENQENFVDSSIFIDI
jgi:acetolactate synthase-1/2/3 large subunit